MKRRCPKRRSGLFDLCDNLGGLNVDGRLHAGDTEIHAVAKERTVFKPSNF
jgi:hypothetical protein